MASIRGPFIWLHKKLNEFEEAADAQADEGNRRVTQILSNKSLEEPISPLPKGKVVALIILVLLVVGATSLVYTTIVATSNARIQADATATADADGTAIAETNVTATANVIATTTAEDIAANPYPSYLLGKGTFALHDPLSNNNRGYDWGLSPNCAFTGNAYHVSQQANALLTCTANSTHFGNLAFEVNMVITQGDCGGIVFRSQGNYRYYLFVICQNSYFKLIRYSGSVNNNAQILTSDYLYPYYINSGIGQSNLLAIVANGARITLYVNKHRVTYSNDDAYTDGQIGFVAYALNHSTDVAFSNAKVWTL
jgi:hypothetical protein